jgi:hypothetical protein
MRREPRGELDAPVRLRPMGRTGQHTRRVNLRSGLAASVATQLRPLVRNSMSVCPSAPPARLHDARSLTQP